jgi:enoyl-CoA hydratase/carnithine racemase
MLTALKTTKAKFPHEAQSYEKIRLEIRDHIGYIWLTDKTHTVDADFLTEIATAHEALDYDDNVHGVIWMAETNDVFAGGLDTALLQTPDAEERLRLFRHFFDTTRRLYAFSKPEIALIQGEAFGAGAVLAATSDWRFVTPNTYLSFTNVMPPIVLPDTLLRMLTAAMGASNMKELIRSGGKCRGEGAVLMGVAHETCYGENLLYRGEIFMRRLILNPLEYLQARKKNLRQPILKMFEKDVSLGDSLLRIIEADLRANKVKKKQNAA